MSRDTRRGSDDTSLVPLSVDLTPRTGSEAFKPPMIPGAREPGMLTTFGVHPIVFSGGPIAMDAVTTAARQREGGGAPNQRRPAREGSLVKDLWRRLQRSLRDQVSSSAQPGALESRTLMQSVSVNRSTSLELHESHTTARPAPGSTR